MTGFNHALVGGLVGKFLPLPLALPLAIASHFALDMLPHYGMPHEDRDHSKFWKIFFTVDFFATLGLAVWAIYYHHYAMYLCGQLAVLPDFVWVAKVIRHRTFHLAHHNSKFEQWHINIQKHEYAWGLWPELLLSIVLFYVVIIQTT
jgi:hypothetical protein